MIPNNSIFQRIFHMPKHNYVLLSWIGRVGVPDIYKRGVSQPPFSRNLVKTLGLATKSLLEILSSLRGGGRVFKFLAQVSVRVATLKIF